MAIKFNRSQTFATNGTVTASGLHNLVDGLDIYQALITDQTNLTSVGTADELLIADADLTPNDAPRAVTVQELFNDALSVGTYTDAYLTGNFTTGTANITTGTIPSLTIGTTTATRGTVTTLNSTTGTITNLTAGTTISTAANITNGTVQTLTASTGNITLGTIGTLTSTTGTIGNLTTTLAGDLAISGGTATLGTTGVTAGTYGGATSIPIITLDAKGRVTTASTSSLTTGYTGFRNRIINGDMRIDQRNAGASQSFTSGVEGYAIDRFIVKPAGGNVTGQRVSGSGSDQYRYQITGGASVTQIQFEQKIEASNCSDLAGQTATISIKTANSLLTTVNWILYYANATDNFGTNTIISSGSWTVSSAISNYSANASIPAAATTGLYLILYVGAQTSGTWTIGNVQLEAGSTATDFERRPIGTELALCQRYYEIGGSHSGCIWSGYSVNGSVFYYGVPFIVTKRATPTIYNITNAGQTNFPAVASTVGGVTSTGLLLSRTANATGGGAYFIDTWNASAEL